MKLTPRSFSFHPSMPFYGSDHKRSQSSPWSGTSTGLTILRICSRFSSWGLSPPCIHMIFSSTSAQTGMTLNTSENSFHSLRLYFLLPNIAKHITLIVKAVNSIDRWALVIAPQEEEIFRVLDLISQKQGDALNGLFSSIYVIAQKQVILVTWKAAILKQLDQVWELTVNIAWFRPIKYHKSL